MKGKLDKVTIKYSDVNYNLFLDGNERIHIRREHKVTEEKQSKRIKIVIKKSCQRAAQTREKVITDFNINYIPYKYFSQEK